ncbi:hypothetical protein A4A49_38631 [Nicotiana attenuata]|uniref:Uncharacterized protein n=1 Tax=Nicotiana attenuata TaxID=49451 RepID=A0A1J6JR07_NICAT|nr:hypothetical protein A4A49_38631 [Nicotiana attenuata]
MQSLAFLSRGFPTPFLLFCFKTWIIFQKSNIDFIILRKEIKAISEKGRFSVLPPTFGFTRPFLSRFKSDFEFSQKDPNPTSSPINTSICNILGQSFWSRCTSFNLKLQPPFYQKTRA